MKVIVEKKCPFCDKDVSLEVEEEGLDMYNSGVNITQAFPDLSDFDREKIITGMCDDCQSKTWHRPKPGDDSWGALIGSCPQCDANVYELMDANVSPEYPKMTHKCAQCYMPLIYDADKGTLDGIEEED